MHAFHVSVAVCSAALSASASAQVDMVEGRADVASGRGAVIAATGRASSGSTPEATDPGNLPESLAFKAASRVAQDHRTRFGYDAGAFLETVSGSIEDGGSILLGGRTTLEIGDFTIVYDETAGFRIIDNIDLIGLVLFDIVVNDTRIEPSDFDVWGDVEISRQFSLGRLDLGIVREDLRGEDSDDARVQGFDQPVPGPAVGSLLALSMIGLARRRR